VPGNLSLLVGLLLIAAPVTAAGEEKAAAPPTEARQLAIRVIGGEEWKCEVRDVEKVLDSAAGELWRYCPERKLPPIEVSPRGGPIVLFGRGKDGQIRVRLNTGERLWAQMAYQFAHEFCHILCEFDDKHAPTKWFEESLCETASLFALRRMAETWQKDPPYPNWRSYAPHLAEYAAERLKKAKPPAGKTFPQWYRDNAEALRANATDRDRNTVVAGALLPLLEADPQAWQSVSYLNKETFPGPYTFQDHLKAWRRLCPEKQKAFVSKVAAAFQIDA
jgi:hypothetical protein